MNIKNNIAAPITIVALATACSPLATADDALEAVDAFHERYNAGQYGAMWAAASSGFQESNPRDQFIEFMQNNAADLGEVKDSHSTGYF